MRLHHQKTGTNRNAGRNTVSVSVTVLLALVMLAAGVCGGFLLTREPEPAAFESTTRAGTLAVRSEPYDDERSVTVTVERSESGSVAAPVGGVVTELRQCAAGSNIESGSAFIAIDGQPQLALYLRTPPYRTMTSGMKGGDIAALNAELRRLGYAAPDSDIMTWDTVKAFNALAATAGTQGTTQERQWSIDTSLFAWLPQQQVTVKECQARYGGHVEQGADVLTTTSQPVRATFRRNDSSMLQGDRVMEVNGTTFTITDQTADSTDASLLSAIGASNEYRAAQQPSASGQASDTAGSQSDTGQDTASNTINVTYRWKLAKALNVVSVPPAAMYDVSPDSACVVSHGLPVAGLPAWQIDGQRGIRHIPDFRRCSRQHGQGVPMSGQDQLEPMRSTITGLAGTSTVRNDPGDGRSAHVKLDDVGHSFDGDDWLFRHITMTLHPRRVYALVGPSGSGKSTLLSIIAGWQQPAQGTVIRASCGRVCWVLQNPHGVARRKVIDHVALPYIARGERRNEAEEHALALLRVFGLDHLAAKQFRDLSGGEAQRLMLARAVASHAGLLLVDEPTAQLDLATAASVNRTLHGLSISGAIVVVATHDPRTRDACTDIIDLRDYQ